MLNLEHNVHKPAYVHVHLCVQHKSEGSKFDKSSFSSY